MPQRFVKDDAKWTDFCPKLAKWLCLCDNYPYRMSFLVLVIQDRVQKEQVNRLRHKHPSLRDEKYGLVRYCIQSTGENPSKPSASDATFGVEEAEELDNEMPIVEAYFRHVERYIYSHPKARKMLSLDGDPVRGRSLVTHPPSSCMCCAGILHCSLTIPAHCAGFCFSM